MISCVAAVELGKGRSSDALQNEEAYLTWEESVRTGHEAWESTRLRRVRRPLRRWAGQTRWITEWSATAMCLVCQRVDVLEIPQVPNEFS